MKGTILTALAAGALILAGCTKTEVTDVPDSRAISFDNFVTNAVKALDSEDDLTTFYVYGGPTDDPTLFNATPVNNVTSAWSYSPLKYWKAVKTYNFAAYSNENESATGVTLETDNHLKITDYVSDGTKDLIYTYKHDIQCDDALNMPPVELTFYHILSRVAFKFTKDQVSLAGTDIEVSNIKITALNNQGTFTGKDIITQCPYDAWDGQSGTVAQVFNKEGGNINLTDGQTEGQTDYEYLIPQPANGSGLTVTFTLIPTGTLAEDYGKSVKLFSVTLPATSDSQWNPGYTYVYTAEIKSNNFKLTPIIFDVTEVKKWGNGNITGGDDILIDSNTGN